MRRHDLDYLDDVFTIYSKTDIEFLKMDDLFLFAQFGRIYPHSSGDTASKRRV
jgi:hypothetical protein